MVEGLKKASVLDSNIVDILVVYDEIPFSKTGYCQIRRCPLSQRAAFFEYYTYKLLERGAEIVCLGISSKCLRKNALLNFGDLSYFETYEMQKFKIAIPKKVTQPSNLRLELIDLRKDLDRYIELHNKIFVGIDNAAFLREREFRTLSIKKNYWINFAIAPEGIVGICEFEILGSRAVLSTVGVAEEARSKGYGEGIVMCALKLLKEQGVKKVELMAASSNVRAVSLYEKIGFKKTTVLSKWFKLTNTDKGKLAYR
ncbi:MAG: GNAT family N-acetyltransferase [Eubacteriaceae bacterium]|nr:GNAT family N-acetyltransferase [Eubacteriaceae bacterium]